MTSHRPYPLPEGPWVMTQTWNRLLFAHWPVPPAAVQRWIPPALALDTYDGYAWIGIVPFGMTGIRLRGCPPIPGTSRFPEINVRTYVTCQGKPGVWFFSLDAAHRLAVACARTLLSLPYYYARIGFAAQGGETHCRTDRAHRTALPACFEAKYRPASGVFQSRPGSIEHWLTERYCMYTSGKNGLSRIDIHHLPWPLQRAEAEIAENRMLDGAGIRLPDTTPLCHYAERLTAFVWLPTKVAGDG